MEVTPSQIEKSSNPSVSADKDAAEAERLRRYEDPSSFEALEEHAKAAVLTWIRATFKPAGQKIARLPNSYDLKHVFQYSPGGFYLKEGEFKGAMLAAGLPPISRSAEEWKFRIERAEPCPYRLTQKSYRNREGACWHVPDIKTGICSHHQKRIDAHQPVIRFVANSDLDDTQYRNDEFDEMPNDKS